MPAGMTMTMKHESEEESGRYLHTRSTLSLTQVRATNAIQKRRSPHHAHTNEIVADKSRTTKILYGKQINSFCVQEMCWKIQRNRMKTIAEEKKDPEISCQYRLVIPIKTACSTSRYALHDHPQQKRHRGHTKVTITAPKPCHGNFPQRY